MPIVTGSQILAADVVDGSSLASGMILIWHGTIGTIPAGYLICDGNNSTPNLLAKFIEGVATAGTNPGTTGGAVTKYLKRVAETQPNATAASVQGADGGIIAAMSTGSGTVNQLYNEITDARPLYYDVAFIMKS